jgi:hypothetical protein
VTCSFHSETKQDVSGAFGFRLAIQPWNR